MDVGSHRKRGEVVIRSGGERIVEGKILALVSSNGSKVERMTTVGIKARKLQKGLHMMVVLRKIVNMG